MSPDLPEKLLGMSIDDPSDSRSHDDGGGEPEELERFVFLAIGDQRLAVSVDDIKTITNPPAELTRVPRGPEAVEGVVDFRGEITAVIEPRIHFPVDGERSPRQRLVVFDRPTDQQPAAIRVDDVLGVENVPASDVLDESTLGDVDGSALEHPLVVALVKQERTIGPSSSARHSSGEGQQPASPLEGESQAATPQREVGSTKSNSRAGGRSGSNDRPTQTSVAAARTQTGEEFGVSIDSDDSPVAELAGAGQSQSQSGEAESESDSEPVTEIVIETTPLIDVDRFLLASGHRD